MERRMALGIGLILFLAITLSSTLNITLIATAENEMLTTTVSGLITANTTWTLDDSPYIIAEDVIVNTDVFLTIEPGVVVKFYEGTSLEIDGGLIAQGNSTHKITFTSNSTTPAPADYVGIRVRSSAEHASFDHCIAE